MGITLTGLIRNVENEATQPLLRLRAASQLAADLQELPDQLLGVFVDGCRQSGHSWSEIGDELNVSRQAAQKRFADAEDRPTPDRPDRVRQDHYGKYRALWTWLSQQRGTRVEASFEDLERILGFQLPPSSRKHQPHWHSYDGSAVARAIIDAGWRAEQVDLEAETLVLRARVASI